MRAFAYARVSTKDKAQDVENQLPEMRKEAQRLGWELKGEFIDHASASGKKKREQFDAMIAACEHRQADVILIWALDRFSREGPLRTLLLIDRLSHTGVKVKSMREPWLDPSSPTYELLLPIFAWIAKQERVRLGERVRAGLERVKASGRRLGRPREQLNMKRMRALRAQGLGWRTIAREMSASYQTVRRALKMSGKTATR